MLIKIIICLLMLLLSGFFYNKYTKVVNKIYYFGYVLASMGTSMIAYSILTFIIDLEIASLFVFFIPIFFAIRMYEIGKIRLRIKMLNELNN